MRRQDSLISHFFSGFGVAVRIFREKSVLLWGSRPPPHGHPLRCDDAPYRCMGFVVEQLFQKYIHVPAAKMPHQEIRHFSSRRGKQEDPDHI